MMEQIRSGAQKAKDMIGSLSESMSQQVAAVQRAIHGPYQRKRNEPEHIGGDRRADGQREAGVQSRGERERNHAVRRLGGRGDVFGYRAAGQHGAGAAAAYGAVQDRGLGQMHSAIEGNGHARWQQRERRKSATGICGARRSQLMAIGVAAVGSQPPRGAFSSGLAYFGASLKAEIGGRLETLHEGADRNTNREAY